MGSEYDNTMVTSLKRYVAECILQNWWWETQFQLPPGATIIPVILGTDKTLMTKLRGDVNAWPIYMTIGNFSRALRRKQNLLSKILLGFIPENKKTTTKDEDREGTRRMKAMIYHATMRRIL